MESINITIDETGRPESKEEENKSMEQFSKKKKQKMNVEEEYEENMIETKDKV
jgi:hypothetical protein